MQIILKKKQLPIEFWSLKDGITQSLIGTYLECKEKVRLSYKEGWSSVQTSNSLTFGTLCHSVLEQCYKYLATGITEWKIENIIGNVCAEYKKLIRGERLWTPEDEETLQLNEGYLQVLLPEYWRIYLPKDKKRKYLAVEKEFKNIWGGNIPLRGKIDVVYSLNENETWIMDHKTSYSLDSLGEEGLAFNLQGLFYVLNWWLETKMLPTGFVQNVIQRPRQRKGANETLQHFIARIKSNVDGTYFKRIQVRITKDEFEFWYEKELKPILDELCGWASGLLPNYRNPSACVGKYGACKFIRVCSGGSKDGLYRRKEIFPELVL